MSDETILLPCPFCGCSEIDEYEGDYGNGVYCMNCGAMMGEPIHTEGHGTRVSIEQAIAAWNTRATLGSGACENVNADGYGFRFECSECGHSVIVHDCSAMLDELPRFCPNCGKAVGA